MHREGSHHSKAQSSLAVMDASCIKSCPPVLDYKTEKYVLTKNRKIGALHRLLHLGILCYIIGIFASIFGNGIRENMQTQAWVLDSWVTVNNEVLGWKKWVLILKKGYQETDSDPHFSVITKLKGVSVTKDFRQVEDKLWDVADFVKPAQGENVLFLVTSFIATPGQVQSVCPESPLILDARCGENLDCPAGESVLSGNGIKTGKCVKLNNTHSTCEIYGWCPVENESLLGKPRLSEAENFTLFIKNAVHFRKFNFSSSNTLETLNETYFKSCIYDPVSSPYCPVFRIQDIIRKAGYSFAELSVLGGVVNAHIEWRCDLDHPLTLCKPHYEFQLQAKENNFRTATYYWNQDGREYRDLLKLYGIRFDISVTGEARKFGVIPTAVSLGTGCAFLGGATFLCDLILLYLDEKASFYRSCKYEEVNPPDEQQSTSPGKPIDNFNQEA